ncbi:alpha/beta hydrolase [Nocardioides sp. GCM10027113]|uniref:alpha/beta hydrolase n=1 Tax=unclassified Nocardioides TaxID=2615069 RepID=UPI0036236CFF
MRNKTVVVLALLLVVALVASGAVSLWAALSADSSGDDPRPDAAATSSAPPTPTEEPSAEPGATDPPSPELARFYEQQLTWSECRDGFQCAELRVPLDYAEPDGRTIDVALLRRPATDPAARVGSLVVNPGGPGVPGTDYAAQASLVFRDPLLDGFDIVGFDPRGTGGSAPVDCLTDAELDEFVAGDPSPDDAAERREFQRAVDAMGEGCAERSGEVAAHVTTVEAARDMDVLRAALGEAEMDYFGASYGTKLGATYAELFPGRVGRFVLDGAVDLSLDSRQLALEQAAGFETALRAYIEDCLATSDSCFLGDDVEEGLETIQDLLADIEDDPLPAPGGRELRVGNAFYGIVTPLYVADYWFVLSTALRSALNGDGAPLMQLSDLYTSRGANGYTDNSMEAIYAINCLDDPYAVTPRQVPAQLDDFEKASPTFGEVFAWGLVGCGGLEVESSVEVPEVRAEGAAPIVVIGTTRDPATPYAWAEALAEQLESGVLVSRDGDGHTAYNAGNDCIDEAVHDYLLDGAVPDDGLSC